MTCGKLCGNLKSIPGIENSKYKRPEAVTDLMCLKNINKARVVEGSKQGRANEIQLR